MRIKEFLAIEEVAAAAGNLDQEVNGLTYDSRKVSAGHIFFAVPGEKADGHDFIAEAVRRNAAAVVFSRDGNWPRATATVRVKDVRRTMGLWAAHFFNQPSRGLKLVGVTGTNGKTTLTYLVESMLQAAGMEPGVIGTISYRYRGHEVPSLHTTPESPDLEQMLAEMARAGVKSVAMEVSSHALAQQRVRGLDFDVGVFTNLSRDHLDYHRDMDEYFSAKSRLFTDYLKVSAKAQKSAVIYGEDPRGPELIGKVRSQGTEAWSYGAGSQWDVHPVNVKSDVNGLSGTIQARERKIEFTSSLIGAANLQNILGAVAVGRTLGLGDGIAAQGIRQLRTVPGRLEKIDNRLGISVLVDYAHTPDALEKVLGAVRPLTRGKLITVFGCGGDRDRGKRPLMGEITGRLSDFVVITSDNPRTEDPLVIVDEVETGVARTGLKRFSGLGSRVGESEAERGYVVEADRRKAIGIALGAARPGDLVLIAGKGHEDYQILGTTKIHFDDREVARDELERRASE
ncbi:MAG TPA: UDP-N-acetylmuramoyl-L-alanyl-D-glutamate--2,6-diaminopimelate ligase [Candidatus Binatia bacterium]|jgi:UDP-N-acetylmuramoyl-L-alanyl-D-glutamate--2,6-diaminopimelate ligase|nr:UDP-N-acetylmuramoyl-L-alanyl-D-glutamate--2,6-diaminopimelate ligase [Candidatus Binatia bacterium]